jgi:hypothetical protein
VFSPKYGLIAVVARNKPSRSRLSPVRIRTKLSDKISPSSLKDRAAGLRTGSRANTSMIFLSFCSASQALSRLSRLRFNSGQVSSRICSNEHICKPSHWQRSRDVSAIPPRPSPAGQIPDFVSSPNPLRNLPVPLRSSGLPCQCSCVLPYRFALRRPARAGSSCLHGGEPSHPRHHSAVFPSNP